MKPLINQAFWSHPDIEASASESKLAALWIITNSQTSLLGICTATPGRFAFETGLPAETLAAVLQALPGIFLRFGHAIFIRGYIRHQFGIGEKLARNKFFLSLRSQFAAVKDAELREAIAAEYPELPRLLHSSPSKGLPTPPQGLTKPKDGKDGKEREEKEGEEQPGQSEAASADSAPPPAPAADEDKPIPTQEEARAYGVEIGMTPPDVDAWFDHYQSNGWRVSGKTPMRDWRAALRNGKRRKDEFRPMNGPAPGSPQRPGANGHNGPTRGAPSGSPSPDAWRDWLKSKGQPFTEYRVAAEFLKSDFHREQKALQAA